ncbi:MAG: hypothetical protein SV775_12295 [Thermodesulfobacteriota bacterium]|nr:hypothetical protein [Thermodesulfobacteriota bacterium]
MGIERSVCIFMVILAMILTARAAFGDHANSRDADGFLWGTEAAVLISDFSNISHAVELNISAVNDTLRTKYVKLRVSQMKDSGFSPFGLDISGTFFDLDETAKLFRSNGWSMVPMLSRHFGSQITSKDIDSYVDFVDWFISRYKDDANIEYVELQNAPFVSWSGTEAQLLELCNKTYHRIKGGYPDIQVGTPGFEYFRDLPNYANLPAVRQIEYFLDSANGANFDFWAFHGYKTLGPKGEYPPTKSSVHNFYAGIPGISEIQRRLNENGWQDRLILDTEYVYLGKEIAFTEESDRVSAAYMVQDLLLKKTQTLESSGVPVLSGALPLKIRPRGEQHEDAWGSLHSDGSMTLTVKAVGLLWSKLNEYKYSSHISGAFDDEDQVWVEEFSSGNKNLYIFFKPFEYHEGEVLELDSQTQEYDLALGTKPSSAVLTLITGETSNIAPRQNLSLKAENLPKFLEVEFPTESEDLWSGAIDLGYGWKYLDWFGWFRVDEASSWIWHYTHGWVYAYGKSTGDIWFWTSDKNWFWTSDLYYPWIYSFEEGVWAWDVWCE